MSDAMRQVVVPAGGAKPLGPYSPGIRSGNLLFASGTTGVDPETRQLVQGGVQEQTRQALTSLSRVLEAGGSSLNHVLKTTVFMVDLGQFSVMNEVYGGFFAVDPPARSTIQVAALPGGAAIEIEAIALVSE